MDDAGRIEPGLYDSDGVAWAETQAAALRRRQAGHNLLDYDNLAEEIEDVGKSITGACRSYLAVIVEHLLKLEFLVQPDDYNGWRRSVRAARYSLRDELTPTLRQRLPDEVAEIAARQAALLAEGALIEDASAVLAALGGGYSWEQLTDVDWYPPPRSDETP